MSFRLQKLSQLLNSCQVRVKADSTCRECNYQGEAAPDLWAVLAFCWDIEGLSCRIVRRCL